ncbi:MAG: hypothetical protein JSV88_27525 [Candidatus Aminicenantes bacterium]|nr:MAG: hypothetical protein JSV88_27525 [Candidatus Aminicenantes bacterium]
MAFERDKFDRFTQVLKSLSRDSELEMRCKAENFLLEERLTELREDSYEEYLKSPSNEESWNVGHEEYVDAKIYVRSGSPETFSRINRPNLLLTVEPDQFLVRVENISDVEFYHGKIPHEIIKYCHDFLKYPENTENRNIIKDFLKKWYEIRDFRPVFVGFWGEIEDIFSKYNKNNPGNEEWPNRLRDRLGLGHLTPGDGAPIPILVFRYRIKDVLPINSGDTKNVAIPTVLDGCLTPYFCPTPKKGWNQGQALDLSSGDEKSYSINCEILHHTVEYKPEFLYNAGWITKSPGKSLEEARKIHLDFLIDDFENKLEIREKEK